MKLFSPAKINLFLNVLSKRPDGYHNIQTLFERISLGDTITLKKIPKGIRLRTNVRNIPTGSKNLAVQAARLLQEECGVKHGVEIILKKRIPVAAGLGGGSSNAATVLVGLNKLWKLNLSRKTLLRLAFKLGSDAPFFVYDRSWAFGQGRGEKLEPVRVRRTLWHCLAKPAFGISTRRAYQGLSGMRLTPTRTDARMLLRLLQKSDPETLSKRFRNSLELTLNKRVKTISKMKEMLQSSGAFLSLMSGSGSAVFGLFRSEHKARLAARRLKAGNPRWAIFVVCTY